MMEMYKKSNLTFEVIYEDGSRRLVKDGILFECDEDNRLNMHLGTDNQVNMFVAIIQTIQYILKQKLGN